MGCCSVCTFEYRDQNLGDPWFRQYSTHYNSRASHSFHDPQLMLVTFEFFSPIFFLLHPYTTIGNRMILISFHRQSGCWVNLTALTWARSVKSDQGSRGSTGQPKFNSHHSPTKENSPWFFVRRNLARFCTLDTEPLPSIQQYLEYWARLLLSAYR